MSQVSSISSIPHEKRVTKVPVTHDRRIDERIAVLEVRVDNIDTRHSDSQEMLEKFFNKLDEHITEETGHTITINTTMLKVSNTVDNLTNEIKRTNDNLVSFATKVEDTHVKVSHWHSAIQTTAKICVILSVIISAGWAVFEFKYHKPDIVQIASTL